MQFFRESKAIVCWGAMETEGLQGAKLPFQNYLGKKTLFYIFSLCMILIFSVVGPSSPPVSSFAASYPSISAGSASSPTFVSVSGASPETGAELNALLLQTRGRPLHQGLSKACEQKSPSLAEWIGTFQAL